MDLGLGDIANELARELAGNGTPICLTWAALAPGAAVDPVDGYSAGWLAQTLTLAAFVHQVQPTGASAVRQFNEIEVGDLILDFAADAPLDGKRGLVFWVSDKAYVAKEVGSRLAASWDVSVAGRQLLRSVLVKVKV